MKGMKELHQRMAADVPFRAQMAALAGQNPTNEQMIEALKGLGYDISAKDLTGCASCGGCELGEEDLEATVGGILGSTQNRYDSVECAKITEVSLRCVGFLSQTWCDHYRRTFFDVVPGGYANDNERYRYTCVMGCFNYIGNAHGDKVD